MLDFLHTAKYLRLLEANGVCRRPRRVPPWAAPSLQEGACGGGAAEEKEGAGRGEMLSTSGAVVVLGGDDGAAGAVVDRKDRACPP